MYMYVCRWYCTWSYEEARGELGASCCSLIQLLSLIPLRQALWLNEEEVSCLQVSTACDFTVAAPCNQFFERSNVKPSLYTHSQEPSQEYSSQLCEKLAWQGKWSVRGLLLQKIACGVEHWLHTQLLTHYTQWHRQATRYGMGHFTFFPHYILVVMRRGTDRLLPHRRQREETAPVLRSSRRLDLASHPFVFHKDRFFLFCLFFWSSEATKISYTSLWRSHVQGKSLMFFGQAWL